MTRVGSGTDPEFPPAPEEPSMDTLLESLRQRVETTQPPSVRPRKAKSRLKESDLEGPSILVEGDVQGGRGAPTYAGRATVLTGRDGTPAWLWVAVGAAVMAGGALLWALLSRPEPSERVETTPAAVVPVSTPMPVHTASLPTSAVAASAVATTETLSPLPSAAPSAARTTATKPSAAPPAESPSKVAPASSRPSSSELPSFDEKP